MKDFFMPRQEGDACPTHISTYGAARWQDPPASVPFVEGPFCTAGFSDHEGGNFSHVRF